MSRPLFITINVLIYWALVTGFVVLQPGSWGQVTALIAGGLLFAVLGIAVEPVLTFFKFPSNFWGLFIVGFLLNLLFFVIASTGIIPSILIVSTGSFGTEFNPLPFPVLELGSSIMVSLLFATLGTLLQILVRRLAT